MGISGMKTKNCNCVVPGLVPAEEGFCHALVPIEITVISQHVVCVREASGYDRLVTSCCVEALPASQINI